MKIIDKNKDFYDYLSHIYGIDENIAFDRRGSTILTDDCIKKFIEDTKNTIKWFYPELLILEIGFVHYIFNTSCLYEEDKTSSLNHIYTDGIHFSKNPICLYFNDSFNFRHDDFKLKGMKAMALPYNELKLNERMIKVWRNNDKPISIELPIMDKTFVTSIIKPEEIWRNIYHYLCKINEPIYIDTRDDVSKAIDHGFDKKTSFRHPVK